MKHHLVIVVASTMLIANPLLAAPDEGKADGSDVALEYAMVDVNAGSFLMGLPGRGFMFPRHTVAHQVEITRPYAIGIDEVHQDLWVEIMHTRPWRPIFNRCFPEQLANDDQTAATCVSWYEVVDFCNRLSALARLQQAYEIDGREVRWNRDANGYRLPTEAEWEYAARGGNDDPHTGFFNAVAARNYRENMYHGRVDTAAAEPNIWGIRNMVAKMSEWVWDYYDKEYELGPAYDPIGAERNRWRVVKGEGWYVATPPVRAAARSGELPWLADISLGFRLARTTADP